MRNEGNNVILILKGGVGFCPYGLFFKEKFKPF